MHVTHGEVTLLVWGQRGQLNPLVELYHPAYRVSQGSRDVAVGEQLQH